MLIKFAYSLRIGVNDNRSSPSNTAALPGSPFSETSPGRIYMAPVHASVGIRRLLVRLWPRLHYLRDLCGAVPAGGIHVVPTNTSHQPAPHRWG
jgi:hypothetical protein